VETGHPRGRVVPRNIIVIPRSVMVTFGQSYGSGALITDHKCRLEYSWPSRSKMPLKCVQRPLSMCQ